MADAPDIDANEITDKGCINQRAGPTRCPHSAQRHLLREPPEAVIVL